MLIAISRQGHKKYDPTTLQYSVPSGAPCSGG